MKNELVLSVHCPLCRGNLERLIRVVSKLPFSIVSRIEKIHDEKGGLEVTGEFNGADKEVLKRIWNSEYEDGDGIIFKLGEKEVKDFKKKHNLNRGEKNERHENARRNRAVRKKTSRTTPGVWVRPMPNH